MTCKHAEIRYTAQRYIERPVSVVNGTLHYGRVEMWEVIDSTERLECPECGEEFTESEALAILSADGEVTNAK